MVTIVYTKKTARLSPCGEYRYTLTRRWDSTKARVCWVMLNPSIGKVIIAWGAHGALYSRDQQVLALIKRLGYLPWCLSTSKDGFPKHPLRLAGSTPLEMFD